MNYLLGAGNFGIVMKVLLEHENIKIDGFVDLNPLSKGAEHSGLPLISKDSISINDTLIVATNRYNHSWLVDEFGSLASLKFPEQLVDISGIDLLGLDFPDDLAWSKEKAFDSIRDYINIRSWANISLKSVDNEKPFLTSLDIVVTERCTLKCTDCSNLMQYYEKPQNSSEEVTYQALVKILSQVNVGSIRLIGGEPLLSPALTPLIANLYENHLASFNCIEIYTNGTLLPKAELINILKLHDLVTFYISDYGDLSRNKQQLLDLLKKEGIRYALESNLTWQDCGKVMPYSSDNINYKYANCCVSKTFSLLNNLLYSCPFSANFHNIYEGEIRSSRDCIDISECTPSELKQRIFAMVSSTEPLSACYYCNGRDYTVPNVEVAVQTRQILRR